MLNLENTDIETKSVGYNDCIPIGTSKTFVAVIKSYIYWLTIIGYSYVYVY